MQKTSFYKKILTSKNTKEIWKRVHRILNPSGKTPNANTIELNKYFTATATRLIVSKTYNNDELKNLMESLPRKKNEFQCHSVSYEHGEQSLELLRNYCSTGYDSIIMFIKPVAEILVSPFTFVVSNYIKRINFPRSLENC